MYILSLSFQTTFIHASIQIGIYILNKFELQKQFLRRPLINICVFKFFFYIQITFYHIYSIDIEEYFVSDKQ